jgi:hypothetical protein
MTNHDTPSKGRTLNMEEKRKLEKLLLSDIDAAEARYSADRGIKRQKVTEHALHDASPAVRTLYKNHIAAYGELERTEKGLAALGYRFCGYGAEKKLDIGYGIVPKEVLAFDDETAKAKSALTNMKRTYILKLFAGGEEAKELFAALATELKQIIL